MHNSLTLSHVKSNVPFLGLRKGSLVRLLLLFLMLCGSNMVYSQQTSNDKYTGNWEDPESWSSSWGTSGPIETLGISQDITINGFITNTGDISFDGSGGNLIINDTLIINGNLSLGNNNNITVNNNGILIVRGNVTLDNNVDIATNAYIVITGNLTKGGAANQGSFTSTDSPSKVFIGGSINVPGGWASGSGGVLNCNAPTEYSSSNCNYGNNIDILNDPILPFVQSSCGTITINTQPTDRTICSGNTSFLITATGATSYQWQVSTGGAFANLSNGGVYSGVTTNTLTLTGPGSSLNGYKYRCVAYTGTCSATSNAATLCFGVPSQPEAITGSMNVCSGTTGNFSVTNVPGVNYLWTYSGSGATISGNTTNNVSIAFSSTATSGILTVTPSNLCGTGTARTINLSILNPVPPQITGPTQVFTGRTQIYSTSPEKSAYNWVVNGGTISSGQGTNSIVVNWDNNQGTGSLQVSYLDNTCTVSSGVNITKSNFNLACYQYKRPVNIAGSMVSGGPYTNFPLVINITDLSLRSVTHGGHIAHNAGYDIYFSQNADGSNPLDYQLDYYDPVTGKLVVWVRMPSLSNVNSAIYLFYGNYSVTFDASTSNVWSSDYIGVYHMGNSLEDFGIYQNNGSNVGTALTNNGFLGQGRDFVRAEKDFIQIDNEPAFNFTTQQTVSFWMKLDSYSASAWTDYMAKGDNANWRFVGNPGARTMYYSFGTGGLDNGYTSDLESSVQINAGQWYYVVGTFNGSSATRTKTLYINGAQRGQISTQLPSSMQSYTINNKPLLIGINSQADDQRAFDGIMDEIHISTQQKSAGWITTEYNNQGTPGNITLGTEAVNVVASASGGTASASPTSIYAREYSYLTVSGYTGTSVQWQWSTDNISFMDMDGKTTATSQQTDPLLTNTYFRAMVTNGGCPSASTSVLVNVNPPFITCATGKRKKITIPDANYTGSDNLINFPFLVQITDPDLRTTANGGKVNSPNGWDIRFTASDGVSLLAHQVESYDASTGKIVAWVQIPVVYATGNTEIFMNYGDAALAASNPSTSATWTSDYKMVLHMSGTGNPTDNSQGAITATNTGTTSVSGKIDDARNFNGTDQYITLNKESNFDIANNGKITLSAWLNVDSWTTNARIIDKGNISKTNAFNTGVNDNAANTGWSLSRDNTNNQINMWQQYQISGYGAPQHIEARNNPGLAPGAGAWHYLVATFDHETNNMIIYVDGSAASSTKNDPTNEILVNNDLNVRIGANANSLSNYFDGRMDEVRIQGVSRSADWIKFEYDNQNNPGSFITLGPEEGCNLGAPTAGTISSNVSTLCVGQSANLTLSGYSGGIYWQKSMDGTTWTYITGANNPTFNTGSISQNTYYRASVSNCCEAFSTPILITYVASAPPSATFTPNSPLCVNGSLTLSGAPSGMSSYSWTGPNSFSSSLMNPLTISNVTAVNSGNYTLTVVAPNGCKNSSTSSITVNPTPQIGPMTRTVCSGSAFIIIPEDGTNGVVPSGTTYSWNFPVVTGSMTGGTDGTGSVNISGALLNSTSSSQTATYAVTPVSGMCSGNSFNVTISVTPTNTAGAALSTSTPCIGNPLATITHSTTGATGIGAYSGLPTGVTAAWASNIITISGTPTQSGTFNYNIPLTGGCGNVSATGSITVNARPLTGELYRKPNN